MNNTFDAVNLCMQSIDRGWDPVLPVHLVDIDEFNELVDSAPATTFLLGVKNDDNPKIAKLSYGNGDIFAASAGLDGTFDGSLWPVRRGMVVDGAAFVYVADIPHHPIVTWRSGNIVIDPENVRFAEPDEIQHALPLPRADFSGRIESFDILTPGYKTNVSTDSKTLPRLSGDFVTKFYNPGSDPVLVRIRLNWLCEYAIEIPAFSSVSAMPDGYAIPMVSLPFDTVYICTTGSIEAHYRNFPKPDAETRKKFILTRYYHDLPDGSRVHFSSGGPGVIALPRI
jgi:hypothetical protein